MLKPAPVRHIRLIGLKAVEGDALRFLQEKGVFHISKMKDAALMQGSPLPEFGAVSSELVRIRGIKNALFEPKENGNDKAIVVRNPVGEAAAVCVDKELIALKAAKDEAQRALAEKKKLAESADRLRYLEVDKSRLPDALDYMIISVKKEASRHVRAKVEQAAVHVQWLQAKDGAKEGNEVLLAALPKGAQVRDILADAELLDWNAPGMPKRVLQKSKFEIEELEDALRANERQLQEISRQYYHKVCAIEEALTIEADRCEIASRFGESIDCFHMEGWVRESDCNALEKGLEGKFGKKIVVQKAPHSKGHGAHGMPTVLENPKIAGPFQYLVEMLSLPQPNEIDPTMLIALFLPILYGMIVGDAGYAVISLGLAALLIKISAPGGMMRQFSTMWALCALPAFVFGILYDEYFGFTHSQILGLAEPLYTPIVHRVSDVQFLLLLSIFAGLIHLGIGFLLGFINEIGHSWKHALVKLGWLAVEIGGVLAVAGFMFNAIPQDMAMIGAGILGAGSLCIVMFEGVVGIFEIPGLASNIMSYARIAAVGVAGVILAEIINELLLPDPKMLSTPEGILMFIVVGTMYVVLHIFNTFIAMFESLIHGARLNVIEFYGKFYKGNGIRFMPFAAKRRYTAQNGGNGARQAAEE